MELKKAILQVLSGTALSVFTECCLFVCLPGIQQGRLAAVTTRRNRDIVLSSKTCIYSTYPPLSQGMGAGAGGSVGGLCSTVSEDGNSGGTAVEWPYNAIRRNLIAASTL